MSQKMNRQEALDSINCIERVCCPPGASTEERVAFLCALGCEERSAKTITAEMERLGLAFATRELLDAVAQIANHPNRKAA